MTFQKIPFKFKITKKKWRNISLNNLVYKELGYFYKKKVTKKVKRLTLKRLFNYKLQEKQKFKYFYGNILNYRLKKFHKLAKKKSKFQVFKNFIQLIEPKLDIVLYRSFFINNIFNYKYFIRTGYISVNNKIIRNNHYMLKPGDIIKFNLNKTKKKGLLKNYIKNYKSYFKSKKYDKENRQLFLNLLFPKHLEISYKTLTILYKNNSKHFYYPISLDLEIISRYY